WEYVEQLLHIGVDSVGRDDAIRKGLHRSRRVPAERIDDLRRRIERAIGGAHRLIEITLAFRRGRHRVIAWILSHGAGKKLLREEEEEFVLSLVEVAGNVNRAADISAHRFVTIGSSRPAG